MGSVVVVEFLPFRQFLIQIYIVGVCEQLIELFLVRAVGSLDFAVELWRAWLDIHMSDPLVFNVPVKLRLKFMTSIGSDRMDPERKLLDHAVNEIDGALLIVTLVDLERSDPCGVIDRRVLKSTNFLAVDSFEREELHVHLDVMTGNLFCIATCVNRSATYFPRQTPEAISDQRAIDARTRGLDAVVALEIPGNPLWAEVIDAPEVKDLLDNLWGELAGVAPRDRFLADEPFDAFFLKGSLPAIER